MSNKYRKTQSILKSKPVTDGAGVSINRAFGYFEVPLFDPFLLLDNFHSEDPDEYMAGFPWHPHRGIETITYMLKGSVEHRDSIGNKGVISSGDIQWMTAGSGIVHQEMPQMPEGADKAIGGFQLWANLPAKHKMMKARYQDIPAAKIPVVELPAGGTVKVICGKVNNTTGPVKDIVIDPEYLHVTLPANASFAHPAKKGHNVFAYVFTGSAAFSPDAAIMSGLGSLVLFDRAGEEVEVRSGAQGAQFLLISGKPLNEPVAWRGPIVMNTDEELRSAFTEYENGTFIK